MIHVCRKRLTEPEQVSYARMRKFVREEATRLKSLLETVHGKELPEADLRVILRGKSLEFYSQHYGVVQTGTGEMLGVRDALLGINQMLDDILEDAATAGGKRRSGQSVVSADFQKRADDEPRHLAQDLAGKRRFTERSGITRLDSCNRT